MRSKLSAGVIGLVLVSGSYLLHRLGLRWGATDNEVRRPLPGDDLVPDPMLETTHAATINALRGRACLGRDPAVQRAGHNLRGKVVLPGLAPAASSEARGTGSSPNTKQCCSTSSRQ